VLNRLAPTCFEKGLKESLVHFRPVFLRVNLSPPYLCVRTRRQAPKWRKCPALPLVGPPAGARAGRQVYLEGSPRLTEPRMPNPIGIYLSGSTPMLSESELLGNLLRVLQRIGVGKGFHPPRPPNRVCSSPARASPVGGFLIGNGLPVHRPRSL
jgi:hypothetical protein